MNGVTSKNLGVNLVLVHIATPAWLSVTLSVKRPSAAPGSQVLVWLDIQAADQVVKLAQMIDADEIWYDDQTVPWAIIRRIQLSVEGVLTVNGRRIMTFPIVRRAAN